MPTRKQRRRQQKLRRHEYEEVYVDEEGNVVELDEAEADAQTSASTNGRRDRSASRPARAAQARGGRTIQPPSWQRVLKRGAIFAPVMFILVSILPGGSDISIEGRVLNTLFLVAIFLPFSYLMDTITYRIWRKRTGAG